MTNLHEAHFQWPYSEPGSVIVTGTFDEWKSSIPLTKGPYGFEAKVEVPWESKVLYKFVVDGRWLVQDGYPTEWDPIGNLNNVYYSPTRPEPTPPPTPPEPAAITPNDATSEKAISELIMETTQSAQATAVGEGLINPATPADIQRDIDITGRENIGAGQEQESSQRDRSGDQVPSSPMVAEPGLPATVLTPSDQMVVKVANTDPPTSLSSTMTTTAEIIPKENNQPAEGAETVQEADQINSDTPRPQPSDGIDNSGAMEYAPIIPMPIVRVNAPEFNTIPRESPTETSPPAQEVLSQNEEAPVDVVISALLDAEPTTVASVEKAKEAESLTSPAAPQEDVHPSPPAVPGPSNTTEASSSSDTPATSAAEETSSPIIVTDGNSTAPSVATDNTAVDDAEVKIHHEHPVVPAIPEEPAEATPRAASPAVEPTPPQAEQEVPPAPSQDTPKSEVVAETTPDTPAAEVQPIPDITPGVPEAEITKEAAPTPVKEEPHAKENGTAIAPAVVENGTAATPESQESKPAKPASDSSSGMKEKVEPESPRSAPPTLGKSKRHTSWSSSKSPSKNGTVNSTGPKKKRTSIFGKLKDIFAHEKHEKEKKGSTKA